MVFKSIGSSSFRPLILPRRGTPGQSSDALAEARQRVEDAAARRAARKAKSGEALTINKSIEKTWHSNLCRSFDCHEHRASRQRRTRHLITSATNNPTAPTIRNTPKILMLDLLTKRPGQCAGYPVRHRARQLRRTQPLIGIVGPGASDERPGRADKLRRPGQEPAGTRLSALAEPMGYKQQRDPFPEFASFIM